jgi:hypothetical protein
MTLLSKAVATAALLIVWSACLSATTFRIDKTEAGPWTHIFNSIGIMEGTRDTDIIVLGPESEQDVGALSEQHLVIVQGLGRAARSAGILPKPEQVSIRQICDMHGPDMRIIWQQAIDMPEAAMPAGFEVFATERWKNAPVIAGKRTAHGGVLWLATDPGTRGSERYPYLLQAMQDLGLTLPARATNLWALFDSAYRIRADPDYLARRWRRAGIGVLHVAAWHNMDGDSAQDGYVKRLIAACHSNAILVYAWLELPHVSEKFWADHPEWREKTALGQDAELDWRKLMNLHNAACRKEAATKVHELLQRFDWDGVNLAELYFESLEGAANPSRFTPMNDDVRREFASLKGFDPKALFEPESAYSAETHPEALHAFLDYRAHLAVEMQREWLDILGDDKVSKPYLDVVVTQIDDREDPGIRDELGADAALSLPAIRDHRGTLLLEDPATLWNTGPERYEQLAKQYRQVATSRDRLALDINVVERYQDVYPTKKQTGIELLELVHEASAAFGRVALYVENSLEKQDLELLPVAASRAVLRQTAADEIDVKAPEPIKVLQAGPVELDGRAWLVQGAQGVLVPAGEHRLRTGTAAPAIEVADFNGEIRSAAVSGGEAQLAYVSASRAIAIVNTPVSRIEVDGAAYWRPEGTAMPESVILPSGQHVVTLHR